MTPIAKRCEELRDIWRNSLEAIGKAYYLTKHDIHREYNRTSSYIETPQRTHNYNWHEIIERGVACYELVYFPKSLWYRDTRMLVAARNKHLVAFSCEEIAEKPKIMYRNDEKIVILPKRVFEDRMDSILDVEEVPVVFSNMFNGFRVKTTDGDLLVMLNKYRDPRFPYNVSGEYGVDVPNRHQPQMFIVPIVNERENMWGLSDAAVEELTWLSELSIEREPTEACKILTFHDDIRTHKQHKNNWQVVAVIVWHLPERNYTYENLEISLLLARGISYNNTELLLHPIIRRKMKHQSRLGPYYTTGWYIPFRFINVAIHLPKWMTNLWQVERVLNWFFFDYLQNNSQLLREIVKHSCGYWRDITPRDYEEQTAMIVPSRQVLWAHGKLTTERAKYNSTLLLGFNNTGEIFYNIKNQLIRYYFNIDMYFEGKVLEGVDWCHEAGMI